MPTLSTLLLLVSILAINTQLSYGNRNRSFYGYGKEKAPSLLSRSTSSMSRDQCRNFSASVLILRIWTEAIWGRRKERYAGRRAQAMPDFAPPLTYRERVRVSRSACRARRELQHRQHRNRDTRRSPPARLRPQELRARDGAAAQNLASLAKCSTESPQCALVLAREQFTPKSQHANAEPRLVPYDGTASCTVASRPTTPGQAHSATPPSARKPRPVRCRPHAATTTTERARTGNFTFHTPPLVATREMVTTSSQIDLAFYRSTSLSFASAPKAPSFDDHITTLSPKIYRRFVIDTLNEHVVHCNCGSGYSGAPPFQHMKNDLCRNVVEKAHFSTHKMTCTEKGHRHRIQSSRIRADFPRVLDDSESRNVRTLGPDHVPHQQY